MRDVLATVGVPPITGTAPPLIRIVPAALRLKVTVLPRPSPKTDRRPAPGRKVAVIAMVSSQSGSAVPARRCRARKLISPRDNQCEKTHTGVAATRDQVVTAVDLLGLASVVGESRYLRLLEAQDCRQ